MRPSSAVASATEDGKVAGFPRHFEVLSHVNIVASMVFSGVSGSAAADTCAVGSVIIPAMKKEGYSAPYSAAVTAASITTGPIIPPSIPFVIFGLLANTSIGDLFLAGVVPGLLMGLFLLASSHIISHHRKYPAHERASLSRLIKSFMQAFWALLMELGSDHAQRLIIRYYA